MAGNNYALISASDKTGLVDFVAELRSYGFKFMATSRGAELLRTSHIPVQEVSEITKFPEMLGGRVKTLHPILHGGILHRRDNEDDMAQVEEHDIPTIDMVIVNLYPFISVIQQKADFKTAIENIDVGGPCLLRAAAKNFEHVIVISDPQDYPMITKELRENKGVLSYETRLELAQKAFSMVSWYDSAISNYLFEQIQNQKQKKLTEAEPTDMPQSSKILFPEYGNLSGLKHADLRYGENKHQHAAVFQGTEKYGICHAKQIHGIQMGYNNYLDADCALSIISTFDNPACAIVKHANPCGVAEAFANDQVWRRAFNCDPQSAFGGIAAFNRTMGEDLAEQIKDVFLEVLIAPGFTDDAIKIFNNKAKLRMLVTPPINFKQDRLKLRSLSGGFLMQTEDAEELNPQDMSIVSKREPSEQELTDLIFSWHIVKYVKSNAIVIARDKVTVGIGAGQMSRVDSARVAIEKAKHFQGANESVAASDAFIPFPDTVEMLADAGITAIIQTGGSMRDEEVIAMADKYNVAMIFTHMRHFNH